MNITALTYCIFPQATSFIGDADRHEEVDIQRSSFLIHVEMHQGDGVTVDRVPDRFYILVIDMERYRHQEGYAHSLVC